MKEYVFEVAESWQLPDLSGLIPPGGQVRNVSAHEQVTYLDTADARLRRLGVSFERRQAEEGSTWRLVLPHGAHAGVQNHDGDGSVPAEVARQLDGILAGEPLVEVITISTSRQVHQITDSNDHSVLDVADQQNSGTTIGTGTNAATITQWRQIEVSVGSHGDAGTLLAARKMIKETGARRAPTAPLIDRLAEPGPVEVGTTSDRGGATHDAALATYLSRQCGQILLHDVSLRDRGDVTAVHQMRVAIRRLRSVIRGFAIDLEPTGSRAGGPSVLEDLRWVAAQLGAVRDLDVLDRRISAGLAALPDGDLIGPVARHLTETLASRRLHAYTSWQLTWQDERYQRVMATIAAWYGEPPVAGARSAKQALIRTRRRLNRSLSGARAEAAAHPERWHDARKAAKRLRYVAEATVATRPKAEQVAKRAKRLQQQLGEHHDALAAAALLHEQGRAAGARADDNGFSYGLLVADQRRLAAEALAQVPRHL